MHEKGPLSPEFRFRSIAILHCEPRSIFSVWAAWPWSKFLYVTISMLNSSDSSLLLLSHSVHSFFLYLSYCSSSFFFCEICSIYFSKLFSLHSVFISVYSPSSFLPVIFFILLCSCFIYQWCRRRGGGGQLPPPPPPPTLGYDCTLKFNEEKISSCSM